MDPIIATIATVAWQGYVGNRADWAVGKGLSSIPKIVKRLRENGELPPNHSLYKALRFALLDATAYLLNGRIVLDNAFAAWEGFKKESNEWIQDEKKNVDKYLIHGDNSSAVYAEVEKLLLPATNKTTKEVRADLAERAKVYWLKEWQAGAAMDVPREVESLMLYGWREDGIDMDWFDVASLLFAESLKSKENAEAKDAFQNRLLAEIKTETGFTANKMEEVSGLLRTSVDHYDFIKERLTEQGFLLLEIKEKVETGLNEQREDHDTQLRYLKEIGKAVGIRQEALLKDENLTDLLERIKRLEEAVIEKFNEKEEYRIESEAAPASRSAAKAFSAAVKEWEETAGQLQQAKENVESIKAAYIRQKAVFDNIDWATANDRLKAAKAIFYAGGGVKAVDDVLLYEEREKDFEILLKEKERIANTSKNFAEEELILALNRLKDVTDKNRFETTVNHFERSIAIFEDYNSLFEYAYFLVLQNKHVAAIKNYQKAFERIAKDDLQKKSGLLNNLGNLYSDVQQYSEAEKSFAEALVIRRRLAEQNPEVFEPDVATTLNNLGILYNSMQKYGEAEKSYAEALVIHQRLAEQNPEVFEPDVATTLNNLGNLYSDVQEYGEAEKSYTEALVIRRRLAEQNPEVFEPNVATTLNSLGILYNSMQKYGEAEKSYAEALAIHQRLAEQNPAAFEPSLAMTLNNLGILYNKVQEYSEAEKSYAKGLQLYRRLAEQNPAAFEPNLAMTLNNLGILYRSVQEYGEAEKSYAEALVIRRRLAEQNPEVFEPSLAMTLNNLGNLYSDVKRYSEAEKSYAEALVIHQRLAEQNPEVFEPDAAATLNNLGTLYNSVQRYSEAEKSYAEGLQLYRRLAEQNPEVFEPNVATTLNSLAGLYFDVQRYGEAEKSFAEALVIRRRLAEQNPEAFEPDAAATLNNLGILYNRVQEYSEAEKSYAEALQLYLNNYHKNRRYFFWKIINVSFALANMLVIQGKKEIVIDSLYAALLLLFPYQQEESCKLYFQKADELLGQAGSSLDKALKKVENTIKEVQKKSANDNGQD